MRSFALGELGWSLKRYLSATVYEFNEASKGYWRNHERRVQWGVREILWELKMGNPYYKKEDKPHKKSDIMQLSMDVVKKVEKKPMKVTEEDLKFYQALNFNKDGIS